MVLFDYTLAPMGKNVLTAPEIVDAMRAGMADNKDSPVFAAAPMFLQESLLMPYTFGMDFVRTVLAQQGQGRGLLGHAGASARWTLVRSCSRRLIC